MKVKYYGVYRSGFFENYEIKESDTTFPETFIKSVTYYLTGIFETEILANDFIEKQKQNSERSREEDLYGM